MKTTKITLIATVAISIAACHSSKKTTASVASSSPSATSTATTNTSTAAAPTSVFTVAKSPNGIYPPGNEELNAIQVQYKDITLEKLKEGHAIYTQGACLNCHGAKNITHVKRRDGRILLRIWPKKPIYLKPKKTRFINTFLP